MSEKIVSDHTSFDRRSSARARLPATTQKKFFASYRTAYTTLLCIIVTHYWKLGGTATYVAPLLSAISGGSAYFGQWQNDAWKVTYGAVIGSAVGVMAGLSWEYNYLQIILLFIALTWSNRISLWDRLGKVIAAIGIVLGTLWPTLTDGQIIGFQPFYFIVLIVITPYAITGITLLFPRLSLASFAAEEKVTKICFTLNSAVSALVRGFCAADYADLYTAEVDHLVVQLEKDLDELSLLKGYVDNEALVFHKLQQFGPALGKFVDTVRLIVSEISSVRDNLDTLLHNKTQAKFVELLRPILGNLGADIEIANYIINEHLTTTFHIRIYPSFVYAFWDSMANAATILLNIIIDCRCARDDPSTDPNSISFQDIKVNKDNRENSQNRDNSQNRGGENRGGENILNSGPQLEIPPSLQSQARTSSRKLETIDESLFAGLRYFDSSSRSIKMKSMLERRKFYQISSNNDDEERQFLPSNCGGCESFDRTVHDDRDIESAGSNTPPRDDKISLEDARRKELQQTIQRLRVSRAEMIDMYRRARAQYVWHSGCTAIPAEGQEISAAEEEAIAAAVLAETKQLSLRNLGPRAAILHRTSLLTELFCSLDAVLLDTQRESDYKKVTYFSMIFSFCPRVAMTVYDYFLDSFKDFWMSVFYIIFSVMPVLLSITVKWVLNLKTKRRNKGNNGKKIPKLSTSSTSSTPSVIPRINPILADVDSHIDHNDHNTITWDNIYGKNSKNNSSKTVSTDYEIAKHEYEKEVLHIMYMTMKELRYTYAQPMKISIACTITSFFVLLTQLSTELPNSLWAILVVILIRQENTSSSFLTGYQRLEGTVIGAVYAYTMYQSFSCAVNECGIEISTPVLVIWLAFCAFFRDGPRHGYAALVAGFTPIVLFLGNTPSTAEGAWQRVEMTFIGIAIYILIDNLVLPNRTDVALRAGVHQSIQETRIVITESMAAVKILMTIEGIDHTEDKNYINSNGIHSSDDSNDRNDSNDYNNDSQDYKGYNGSYKGYNNDSNKDYNKSDPIDFRLASAHSDLGDVILEDIDEEIKKRRNSILNSSMHSMNQHMQNNTQNINQNMTQNMSQKSPQNLSQNVQQNINQNITTNMTTNISQKNQQDDNWDVVGSEKKEADDNSNLKNVTLDNKYEYPKNSVKFDTSGNLSDSVNLNSVNYSAKHENLIKSLRSAVRNVNTDGLTFGNNGNHWELEEIFKKKISICGGHLSECSVGIARLKGLIEKDTVNLNLVVHEPEIWRRSFPADVYKPLLTCFAVVMKSTRSVVSATKSFSMVLQDIVNRGEWDEVNLHFSTYAFMTRHLLAVIAKTDRALRLASDTRISRKPSTLLSDLTAIVTLNRGCEALQQVVDDHYRQVYSTLDLDFLARLNPYFLVAFQDVFHSVTSVTRNLSHLGIAIRAVRDVEALSAL